jgi:hypothetical protein
MEPESLLPLKEKGLVVGTTIFNYVHFYDTQQDAYNEDG